MANVQEYSVDSSMIASVGYDPGSHLLYLTYHNGRVYKHPGVSQAKFDALLASPSKGAFINKQIKPFHPHQ